MFGLFQLFFRSNVKRGRWSSISAYSTYWQTKATIYNSDMPGVGGVYPRIAATETVIGLDQVLQFKSGLCFHCPYIKLIRYISVGIP